MSEASILEERKLVLELMNTYDGLLTAKQRSVLNDYYRYDLSLGEISESGGISRAAVHDAIAKAVNKMKEFEGVLHVVEKKKDIKTMIETIERVDDLKTKLALYQQLGKDLTDGI